MPSRSDVLRLTLALPRTFQDIAGEQFKVFEQLPHIALIVISQCVLKLEETSRKDYSTGMILME